MSKSFQANADELCFLQMPGGGVNVDEGIDFFTALIQKVNTSSSNRTLTLDEITIDQLREQADNRPDDFKHMRKAIDEAANVGVMTDSVMSMGGFGWGEGSMGGTLKKQSQLRRAVSNVSIGLQRFTSKSFLPYRGCRREIGGGGEL